MKLYEISAAYRAALSELESLDGDGEIPPALDQRLSALAGSLEEKIDNTCRYRAELLSQAAAAKAESDRLAALARSMGNAAERLRGYLQSQLEACGVRELQTQTPFRLKILPCSQPSAKLAEGAAIPKEYLRTKEEFDAQKALADYKDGKALPAEVVVKRGSYLKIS